MFIISAQAEGGNQGVLGPTKIYLAVQPTVTKTDPVTDTPKIQIKSVNIKEEATPVSNMVFYLSVRL